MARKQNLNEFYVNEIYVQSSLIGLKIPDVELSGYSTS
jgi:hypothetical protein